MLKLKRSRDSATTGRSWRAAVVCLCAMLALLTRGNAALSQPVQSFPEPDTSTGEPAPPQAPPAVPTSTPTQPPAPSPPPPEVLDATAAGPLPPPQLAPPAGGFPVATIEPPQKAASIPFAPAVLPYRDGVPTPPGYRLEVDHNSGLALAGTVTLLLSYVAGIGLAVAEKSENGTSWLFVPVAGPWAAIGARDITCQVQPDGEECLQVAAKEISTTTFLALDGLVQVTGVALTLAGLISKQRQFVRMDIGQLRLQPAVEAGGRMGIRATGNF